MNSAGDKLWSATFAQLIFIESMLQFGMYLTRPIISNYSLSLGASMSIAGFLAGLLATSALAIRPVSGAISDKLSKRTLLVISCGLFSASALGCALSNSLIALGVCLALQGFAFAFKSTIVVSLASLVVPEKRIGAGVGLLGLAYTVACAIGPAVGSSIGKSFGYSAVFAASFALLSLGFAFSIFLRIPKERRELHEEGSRQATVKKKEAGNTSAYRTGKNRFSRLFGKFFYLPAIPLSLIAGLLMIAQGVTSSFILVVGEIRGIEEASLYFFFYSLATLAARPLAGKASDAFGVKAVAIPMMLIAAAGMIAAALMDSFAGIVIAGVSMGIGQGSAYCAIQAESIRGVPKSQLGRAANTFYIGPDLCMGLGPIAGGFILQAAGAGSMFLFNAGAIILALILFSLYAKTLACRFDAPSKSSWL